MSPPTSWSPPFRPRPGRRCPALSGLGIRHKWPKPRLICQQLPQSKALRTATIDQLSGVDGIGDVVAESVVEYFCRRVHGPAFDQIQKHDVWPMPVGQVGGPLAGQNFVITGSLQSMSRDQAAEKIRALGGTFSIVSGKDTHFW